MGNIHDHGWLFNIPSIFQTLVDMIISFYNHNR